MNLTRSEVNYREQLISARDFIEQHDHFLVVSHHHPDGDAISSTLATGWLLGQLGKSFTLYNEDVIPKKFSYLWNIDRLVSESDAEMALARYSRVIAVDCADFSRTGNASQFFSEEAYLLNIDHHPTNDQFGRVNVVRTEAAATAEIIYDLICLFELTWNQDIATCIYTGLLTDTGGFRYSNTSAKVLAIASEMLRHGVNGSILNEQLFEKMTYSQFQLLQIALSTMSFACDRKIAWVCLTADDFAQTGALNEDTEGIVNYARNIEGVETGIMFRELNPNEIKVSFRSSGQVDVAQLASSFGGGGHVRAAGCTLHCSMAEAVNQIVKEAGSRLR